MIPVTSFDPSINMVEEETFEYSFKRFPALQKELLFHLSEVAFVFVAFYSFVSSSILLLIFTYRKELGRRHSNL